MLKRPLRILQVSIADILGGAERMAWDLFKAYRQRGHQSWLAVGVKHSKDRDVWPIPNPDWRAWKEACRAVYSQLLALEGYNIRGLWRVRRLAGELAQPGSWRERRRGLHDFHYPGTRHLLELTPQPPDIVHCHNLHHHYFDLRLLPWLSRQVPVVLSLHDAWLLSGLCWHSLDCDRWKTGCGQCPQLEHLQTSPHDATHVNWQRKADIYARSRLHVTTACHWLMRKVEQSILASALAQSRVIPNGINVGSFTPADRAAVRAELGWPLDARICLFVARILRRNPSKDYETFRAAVHRIAQRLPARPLLFIVRGEAAPVERMGKVEIRFFPFSNDLREVVRCYQAADVYVHAAAADTFPLAVLEALACGTPVVATAVGGIPEQVKGLKGYQGSIDEATCDREEATGILVPPKDAVGMAAAIESLVGDDRLRGWLGENAVRDARQRFALERQVSAYLDWYAELTRCFHIRTLRGQQERRKG
jgi:glycosyltransferase involved in cell wall biosynthesis